jgi:hypothetical protein
MAFFLNLLLGIPFIDLFPFRHNIAVSEDVEEFTKYFVGLAVISRGITTITLKRLELFDGFVARHGLLLNHLFALWRVLDLLGQEGQHRQCCRDQFAFSEIMISLHLTQAVVDVGSRIAISKRGHVLPSLATCLLRIDAIVDAVIVQPIGYQPFARLYLASVAKDFSQASPRKKTNNSTHLL